MRQSATNHEARYTYGSSGARKSFLASPGQIKSNLEELKQSVVIIVPFDGVQIADLIKYLQDNALADHIRYIEPAGKESGNKSSLNRKKTINGFWIDNENYLTRRELEIMKRLSKGWLNKEIANDLGLRINTIRNNLYRVYRKFNVGTRSEAMLYFLRIREEVNKAGDGI
jgi:DNA-binding CsgD family transcriptional regulator